MGQCSMEVRFAGGQAALPEGLQGRKPDARAIGMLLLHPTSMDEGEVGSPFSRLLGNSRWVELNPMIVVADLRCLLLNVTG